MPSWYFKPKVPGDENREAIEGEFFATDAISRPGMALVREALQNSLDARDAPNGQIVVSIRLSGEEEAAKAADVSPFLDGLWDHLQADGNGLRADLIPEPTKDCPYIVIEDMGTRGLEGDPARPFRPESGAENHFYHFFRAEGQSDKDASNRGSWGVGKCVFARSSEINCMFGMSIRASDRRELLMGKATLKTHYLADGGHYQDGYFGDRGPDPESHLVMPAEDRAIVEAFSKCFGLQRGRDPGLSVVIPWPDPAITSEEVIGAVLHDYFWPILTGQLEVMVEVPALEKVWLDAKSISEKVETIGGELAAEVMPMLELAQWARGIAEDQRAVLPMPQANRSWEWNSDLIPESIAQELAQDLEQSRPISVRIPVTVRPNEGEHRPSHFDAYMVRDSRVDRGRPTFVREGIIVPKVDAPYARGVCALVIADDPPLAGFLRDAENPSHTEWQHQGSKFRGKYVSGAGDLRFVKRSVHEIIRILNESEQEEDSTLLVDVFSLSMPDEGVPVDEAPDDDDDGDVSGGEVPPIPPARPRAFRIQRVPGGFAVVASDAGGAPVPHALHVRVGYDTRRGNPLKRYNAADFCLDKEPIEVAAVGITVADCAANRIIAHVTEPGFRLAVTGFDPNRDLYIRVTAREDSDASSTA